MTPGTEAGFENVKNPIGFCGIWCGSCVVGNGALREMAKRFRQTTDGYGLREWAPPGLDYDEFSGGLDAIMGLPVCPGCLKGGGRDNCEIRACALERGIEDCTQCREFGECQHVKIVETMRSGAVAAGLFVMKEGDEREKILQEWDAKLREQWPCCVLFHSGAQAT